MLYSFVYIDDICCSVSRSISLLQQSKAQHGFTECDIVRGVRIGTGGGGNHNKYANSNEKRWTDRFESIIDKLSIVPFHFRHMNKFKKTTLQINTNTIQNNNYYYDIGHLQFIQIIQIRQPVISQKYYETL